jgi:NAD(P)H-hydrate epimerase
MAGRYDLSIDGIFGFQFRAPLAEAAAKILAAANELAVGLRAAVDLPSGLNEPGAFRADFTYATGSLKAPVMDCAAAGRLRYLDLGFFAGMEAGAERVLLPSVLAPLAGLRPAHADKRSQGHLLVVAGSRGFPGAALMAVLAGLHSGVGLLTAFVAESLVPAFAAQAPEAMWVGWPESAGGGLTLAGIELLKAKLRGATALVIGPGLGREEETLRAAAEIVRMMEIPVLIDADALQPEIVRSGKAPHVLTPHAGEFKRISDGLDPRALAKAAHGVVVLKGPVTTITDGGDVYHSLAGGPVLSRGGSGDLLAGLTGGLLAQTPDDLLLAAARGVAWHGRAADKMAEACGQTAVTTSQLLDFLRPALRE